MRSRSWGIWSPLVAVHKCALMDGHLIQKAHAFGNVLCVIFRIKVVQKLIDKGLVFLFFCDHVQTESNAREVTAHMCVAAIHKATFVAAVDLKLNPLLPLCLRSVFRWFSQRNTDHQGVPNFFCPERWFVDDILLSKPYIPLVFSSRNTFLKNWTVW